MTYAECVEEATREWAAARGLEAVVRLQSDVWLDVCVVVVERWSLGDLQASLDRYLAARGLTDHRRLPYFFWKAAVRRTLTGAAGLRDAGVKLSLAQTMGLEAAICEVTWVQDTGEVVDFRVVGRVDGLDDPPSGGV